MVADRSSRFASRTLVAHLTESGEKESLSSCPSSSDDDASESPRHRLRYVLAPPVDSSESFDWENVSVIPHKSNKDKSVVVIRDFMRSSRVAKLRDLFTQSPAVYEIKDRMSNLHYAHNAFRVEIAMRIQHPKTYRKLMRKTIQVCDNVWGDMRSTKNVRKNRVIPEMEYIVYDKANSKPGENTYIEPHVDNHSIVTGIVMLSDPDCDFEGGVNRFKGAESEEKSAKSYRECALRKGDLVLFRGEVLTHWITPVTRGKREILQWELSRI